MGLLYAAFLSRRHKITLYTNTEEQAAEINEKGAALLKEGVPGIHRFQASAQREYKEELLIITVKQFQLEPVLSVLASLRGRTLLFLQNGMSHVNALDQLTGHSIYTGTVSHGVSRESLREIRLNGIGQTVYAPFPEGMNSRLIQMLDSGDFPFVFQNDWYPVLAQKLLVNACINPLTGLLNVKNGELVENPRYFTMLKQVFEEVFPVLDLEDEHAHWKKVQEICSNTALNTSSMLQDLHNGRNTEIDSMTGYLLGQADEKGMYLPVTAFLYEAIKGLERDCRRRGKA